MSARPIRTPGPDHPIRIEKNPARIVVLVGGRVIADTRSALIMHEGTYKGDSNYFSVTAGGERSVNAAWTYEAPHHAVASIKDHLAFYPDRIDSIEAT